MTEEYKKYLDSEHWKSLRRSRLELARYRCERCKSPFILQVHHLRYKNLYDVLLTDLVVLCRYCHERQHGIVSGYRPPSSLRYEIKKLREEANSRDISIAEKSKKQRMLKWGRRQNAKASEDLIQNPTPKTIRDGNFVLVDGKAIYQPML